MGYYIWSPCTVDSLTVHANSRFSSVCSQLACFRWFLRHGSLLSHCSVLIGSTLPRCSMVSYLAGSGTRSCSRRSAGRCPRSGRATGSRGCRGSRSGRPWSQGYRYTCGRDTEFCRPLESHSLKPPITEHISGTGWKQRPNNTGDRESAVDLWYTI